MNKREAKQLLANELAKWRHKSHAELASHIGRSHDTEVQNSSRKPYYLEIQVFWDDRPGDNIRVLGSIDDGGWRAIVPLTDDFILSPDGSFVGEDVG